jgi:hypothetical protein
MPRHLTPELIVSCMVALSAVSCGDGPTADTPATTPQALLIVSGDKQSAISGVAVAAPLRVRVTGSDTRPVRNATVHWSVTEGLATLSPVQSTTDANGQAETRVTVGSVTGLVRVSATVKDLAPVSFSLTSVEPCRGTSPGTISLDAPVSGALGPLDCLHHGGQFHDFFRFTLAEQQAVLLSVRSSDFDPNVDLFTFDDQRDRGNRVDTVDATREAKLRAILAPGRYEMAASSVRVGATGPYTVRLSATSPSSESCEGLHVVRGITTSQQLDATDCVDDLGSYYGDPYGLWLTAGERVVLTHSSAEFGPLVQIYRQGGTMILVDQRGGDGTGTASLSFTADLTGLYVVFATSDQMLRTGAYTLIVAEPSAAAASVSIPLQALGKGSGRKAPHFRSGLGRPLEHAQTR